MPSFFGHAVAGYAISSAFHRGRPPRRVWILATACAVAPDLDWFTGFLDVQNRFGLAHRGLFHSLLAAGLLAALAVLLGLDRGRRTLRNGMCIALATFSHGLLDACTFGGTGVAFLQPFSDAHFVAFWQPIFVSPIPLSGRLTDWLLFSLGTEALWIGGPALLAILVSRFLGRVQLDAEGA